MLMTNRLSAVISFEAGNIEGNLLNSPGEFINIPGEFIWMPSVGMIFIWSIPMRLAGPMMCSGWSEWR